MVAWNTYCNCDNIRLRLTICCDVLPYIKRYMVILYGHQYIGEAHTRVMFKNRKESQHEGITKKKKEVTTGIK